MTEQVSVGSRPLVVYGDGPDGPLPDPRDLDALHGRGDADVLFGWVLRPPTWLPTLDRPARAFMAGYGLRQGMADGTVRTVPTRLSTVPALLATRLRPDVAVVGGRPDGAGYRFVHSVGWGPAAANHAGAVVVEVWADAPFYDAPAIPGHVVEVIERDGPPDAPAAPEVGPVERRIGELVAELIPAGATVQWGPGIIAAAVVAALRTRVRVLSGVVTDELAGLAARGLLDGSAEAAYVWGGADLHALAADGRIRIRPVSETHAPGRLAAIDRFVAINTALEVGLDGAVNVEKAGGRIVTGPGGHADYCEAASRSEGGLSIIALRSTHGNRSSIVSRPAAVTTSRTDVGVVVTEHGWADLRHASEEERRLRLIAVAAPEHRDALASGGQG